MSNPAVSVVIPAFHSEKTLARCLQALRQQTYPDFETIVVDSSRDDRCLTILRAFPEVRARKHPVRLLPHGARNLGVRQARGGILVFTDPDIYPAPEWLERLVACHRERGGPVVGPLLPADTDLCGWGTHLVKFDQWLPGPKAGSVEVALTGNFLCPRGLFDSLDGFRGELMLGDAEFSWRLRRRGVFVAFARTAVAYHHHGCSFRAMLRERCARGRDFGRLRLSTEYAGRRRCFAVWLLLILPLRWLKITTRVGKHAWQAGLFAHFAASFPWVLLGEAAWLAGESRAYAHRLFRGVRSVEP